jgi:hypothetical protein
MNSIVGLSFYREHSQKMRNFKEWLNIFLVFKTFALNYCCQQHWENAE